MSPIECTIAVPMFLNAPHLHVRYLTVNVVYFFSRYSGEYTVISLPFPNTHLNLPGFIAVCKCQKVSLVTLYCLIWMLMLS